MNFTYSIKIGSVYKTYRTYIARLNTLEDIYIDKTHYGVLGMDEQQVRMTFHHDALQVREDTYTAGRLEGSDTLRVSELNMWVGDKEIGLRVIKAFKQLAELCKKETKSEPF
jgi:hypothetical protein